MAEVPPALEGGEMRWGRPDVIQVRQGASCPCSAARAQNARMGEKAPENPLRSAAENRFLFRNRSFPSNESGEGVPSQKIAKRRSTDALRFTLLPCDACEA